MQLYHTFISYSRADDEFALKLANDLRSAGVNVWLDQLDIPPGARWDRAVESALETCGRLLIVLSPTSADSENVQDEIGVAFDNNKPIVPILCKPCDVPMRLRRLQHIDFTKDYEQGLRTLLTVLKLPIAAPEGEAVTAAASPAVSPVTRRSEPRLGHMPPPTAKVAAWSASRRNVGIGIAIVAVLVLLVWFGGGGSGTEPAGDDAAEGSPAGTESAFTEVANLKIVNGSDWNIHELYVRRSGETEWGAELLGADVTISAANGAHTLTQIPCETYDVKLVDEDGDECVVTQQDLCGEHQIWEITSESLRACQAGQ